MFNHFILIIFISSATNEASRCGPSMFDRIINGVSVPITEVPYIVSIQEFSRHICGGSIIGREWVLTASHCVEPPNINTYSIRAGSTVHNNGGSLHKIIKIIKHEKYGGINGHPVHDIALLRIQRPFNFDPTRRPIRIFNFGEVVPPGEYSTISGWGETHFGIPVNLQMAKIPIVSKKDCYESYEEEGGINENQVCAAYWEGGIDACYGDSGGPLVVNGRLAALTSWSRGCARPCVAGVYTEVGPYRPWIEQHIKENQ